MKTMAVCLVLSLLFPNIGWASDAYEYATAAIDAFDVVKEAASTQVKVNPTDGAVATMNALMKNAVTQARSFSVALAKMDQFSKSKDTEIRQSVALFSAALWMLQMNSEQTATACESFLNNPRDVLDAPGTAMRSIFELQEQAKSAWDAYARSGISVSYPLTDSARVSNGTLQYLKITQDEREKLKAQLVEAFGPSIKSGVDRTTSMNRIPAASLWQFLDDRWESADGKP